MVTFNNQKTKPPPSDGRRRPMPPDFPERYETQHTRLLIAHYQCGTDVLSRWIDEARRAGLISDKKPKMPRVRHAPQKIVIRGGAKASRMADPYHGTEIPYDQELFTRCMQAFGKRRART